MSALIPVVESVFFHRDEIPVTTVDGIHYVAMRPICTNIGLDWKSQYNRLNRDPVLSTCVVIMTTQLPGDIQSREVVFLPVDYFHGWLFGISANAVKPELRDKIIRYQRECYAVLAGHFRLAHQGTISHLEDENADLRHRLGKAERACFKRYPHWRTIRDLFLKRHPFAQIARRVGRSASACRHAVKRMMETGLIKSRQLSAHKVLSR
jgi:hypothetical protein